MKNNWLVRIVSVLLGVIVIAGVALAVYQKGYYGGRWYKNTTINGVDVSGQTLEASKQKILEEHTDYVLTVTGRQQGSLTIHGTDIDYTFDIGEDFDQLFTTQHEKMALFHKASDYSMEYNVSYDAGKLSSVVSQSALMTGEGYEIQKPVDAHVEYSSEKQQYECVSEVAGNKIKKKAFLSALDDVLRKAEETMDLNDEETYPGVYKAPAITGDDESLQTALTACNNAALRFITWNMGKGVKEQITPEEISQWITYKNGKIKYDNDAIADWVEAFCLKYKTVGKTRTIKDHIGKKVKIYGGDYGWQMDYETTLRQTKKALKKAIDSSLTQAYIDNPDDETQKALTIKKKVVYLNTAYQKDYDNFAVDWDTKNYTEISIADQKVYVIRNGKVALTCKCITGLPVEGRSTPTGAYFIKEHKEAYTLTGADYSTPVVNWVRITWTGTGFHPATWQPWSSWTKDMYKSRGSHGCINLSPTDAKKIYDITKYREAVFIH
jgi:lipoprotein-anchoring transpeptidase ErfK/SrfK